MSEKKCDQTSNSELGGTLKSGWTLHLDLHCVPAKYEAPPLCDRDQSHTSLAGWYIVPANSSVDQSQ